MKMQHCQPKDQVSCQHAIGRNREQESKAGQSRRRRNPTDCRVMKTLRRFNQDRRFANRCPSLINVRKKVESALVLKYQDVAVVENFFLTLGQTYRRQWSIATCDRLGDCVPGICCDKPSLCNSSGMYFTLYSTSNCSAMTLATRWEFQRSFEKPEATAPALTICLSSSNCSDVRLAVRPEFPCRARAEMPPSLIFFLQRLTLEREAPVISTTSSRSYPFSSNSPPCKRRIACKEIPPCFVLMEDYTQHPTQWFKLFLEGNNVVEDKNDLMQDFVSLVTSFCARLYGQRRTKRNTEKLIQSLNENNP